MQTIWGFNWRRLKNEKHLGKYMRMTHEVMFYKTDNKEVSLWYSENIKEIKDILNPSQQQMKIHEALNGTSLCTTLI